MPVWPECLLVPERIYSPLRNEILLIASAVAAIKPLLRGDALGSPEGLLAFERSYGHE